MATPADVRALFAQPYHHAALSRARLLARYQVARLSSPLKLTQAELAVVEAELRALRAQINPHFLLNALSVLHHLVRTQPERTRELILDLSDLFQHSLRSGQFMTLKQELEHVRAYLALEQARLMQRSSSASKKPLSAFWTTSSLCS